MPVRDLTVLARRIADAVLVAQCPQIERHQVLQRRRPTLATATATAATSNLHHYARNYRAARLLAQSVYRLAH